MGVVAQRPERSGVSQARLAKQWLHGKAGQPRGNALTAGQGMDGVIDQGGLAELHLVIAGDLAGHRLEADPDTPMLGHVAVPCTV
eukprot:5895099-Pyramimonas_sp.AAC.1